MDASDIQLPEIDFAIDPLPNLHEVLAELREQGPVSCIQFAGQPIWLVNDYETVSQNISTDEILSAPEAYSILFTTTMGKVLPMMTGKQHLHNRAVVSRVFFPGKMREYAESLFAEEAQKLADGLRDREQVDLVSDFNRLYTFHNIARLLGLPAGDISRLQDWADRIMHSFVDLAAATAAGREMGEYLLPLVEARRIEPEDDVISLLTQAEVEGEGLATERKSDLKPLSEQLYDYFTDLPQIISSSEGKWPDSISFVVFRTASCAFRILHCLLIHFYSPSMLRFKKMFHASRG